MQLASGPEMVLPYRRLACGHRSLEPGPVIPVEAKEERESSSGTIRISREGPRVCRLPAGGRWIRTIGTPQPDTEVGCARRPWRRSGSRESVGATFQLCAVFGMGRCDGIQKTSLISLTSEERLLGAAVTSPGVARPGARAKSVQPARTVPRRSKADACCCYFLAGMYRAYQSVVAAITSWKASPS